MTLTLSEPEVRRPSIADGYQDLLAGLDDQYRHSLIRRLTQGFYEGWRPTRAQLAAIIADDTGQRSGSGLPVTSPAEQQQRVVTAGLNSPHSAAIVSAAAATSIYPGGENRQPRRRSRARVTFTPQLIASFSVDCGQLGLGSRFIARGLHTAGLVQRGTEMCRLVFLSYELHPLRSPGEEPAPRPVTFRAPITCFPDQIVPWADKDGRERHHTVYGGRVIGRRGPWPLARAVREVQFTINQQTPPGVSPSPIPAGRLIVDLRKGNAVWRPA